MKKFILVIFFISLIMFYFSIIGCSTPEGGSSIPWGRPEEWEGQTNMGMGIATD